MTSLLRLAFASIAFLLIQCEKNKPSTGDIAFARETFKSLARGDTKVADDIDWPTFTVLGNNLGAEYIALETEQQRTDFTHAFITQYAASFRDSGGSVSNYTNWRKDFIDTTRTEILADSPKGTLKVTVTIRDGIERVSALSLSE